jgi:hypothetical protein
MVFGPGAPGAELHADTQLRCCGLLSALVSADHAAGAAHINAALSAARIRM